MKRNFKVCLVVILVMLFSVPAHAADIKSITANDAVVSPQFTAILSMSAGLSISSSGKATCSGSVTPASNTYKADMTVSLQKYKNNGWVTIKSWSDSGTGYAGVAIEAHYYVTSGKYRVCTSVSIYNSSGKLLESESFCSEERTYK